MKVIDSCHSKDNLNKLDDGITFDKAEVEVKRVEDGSLDTLSIGQLPNGHTVIMRREPQIYLIAVLTSLLFQMAESIFYFLDFILEFTAFEKDKNTVLATIDGYFCLLFYIFWHQLLNLFS